MFFAKADLIRLTSDDGCQWLGVTEYLEGEHTDLRLLGSIVAELAHAAWSY
jgi:hypothetical protein